MKTLKLSLHQSLALVAGLLGILALVAGNPYKGNTATMNVKELGLLVEKETDHISVEELADWLIQGKADSRLIDVRSEKEFAEYHIPSAENIPVGSLFDAELMRNEKLLLYSEGGIHAAQAWFLLKAQQFKHVYILRDGLAEWKDKILFPSISDSASSEETLAFEKRKFVSNYFGGTPMSGTSSVSQTKQLAVPKIQMPSGVPSPTGSPKKKKKEGC
ncbi:MAG: rhodanese-like domain-containing protein [Ignavibacteriae bacterium]|nr:rhodanese-like domain-containing protein [Ignavibacteriota bacterium]